MSTFYTSAYITGVLIDGLTAIRARELGEISAIDYRCSFKTGGKNE